MRVNIYAEELPPKGAITIASKEINGHTYTGLRIPLYLPVTLPNGEQTRGPFMHHPGDDDSSAITIWGKRDLRALLDEAMGALDTHYGQPHRQAHLRRIEHAAATAYENLRRMPLHEADPETLMGVVLHLEEALRGTPREA